MSTQFTPKPYGESAENSRTRVYGFVDGFNLYHALQKFEPALPVADPNRYQKYKWLCLTSLLKRFIGPQTDDLVGVEYFTAYPNWANSDAKKLRHQQYVAAQRQMGVHVTFGEFRPKSIDCKATCLLPFPVNVEKQTDTNIAMSLIDFADRFDKAIILTGDSDQVPAVKLLKRLYPEKEVAVLPPIGRGAKELEKVCDESFKMTEVHLAACQLPSPLTVMRDGKPTGGMIIKPPSYS
jgi:uncharacterized LabA/DUF88 family protein